MVTIKREGNAQQGRFVLYEDDVYAGEMTFTWAGPNKFIIDHTGVKERFAGKGYGTMLVTKAVEFARKEGVKIIPLCSFARAEFDRNQAFNDVRF